jgi:hypothetical protein
MEETNFRDVDLDAHLANDFIEEEMENEDPILASLTAEEKALLAKIQQKQMEQDFIIQTFKELEHRPSDEEIEQFKHQVGDVYLLSLSEKENFVFRPLRRLEWRTLMQKIQKLEDDKKSEAIVMKATLWPKLDQQNINVLTAGAIDSVRDMILQVSNFIGPETAMQLVRKL